MHTSKKEREPNELQALEQRVRTAELPLIAQLGTADISIQDFLNLTAGDVIELEQPIDNPIVISVGGLPKFLGQAGKVNKKIGIQILENLKGGDENDE